MTKERPPLTNLLPHLKQKSGLGAAPTPVPARSNPQKKDDRVQVIVRLTLDERQDLKRIAADQFTTIQSLCEDAIRDVLRRHGK